MNTFNNSDTTVDYPGTPDGETAVFGDTGCASTINLIYVPDTVIADLLFYPKAVRILTTYIVPLILTFGLLGNLSFLFTLARVKSMRTITNAYLANLSIADLCFIIFVGVRFIWTMAYSPYVFTNPFNQDAGCILMDGSVYLAYFASNGIVNLVSYERYLAICHPLKYRYFNSKKRTAKMVSITWLLAFAISASMAPDAIRAECIDVLWPDRSQYHNLPRVLYRCESISPIFKNYPIILQVVCFLITFCANVVFYTLIIQALMKRKDVSETMQQESQIQSKIQKVNSQVARMLVLNATAFFLCLTPFQFYQLQRVFENLSDGRLDLLTSDQSSILFWISTILNCINASINPVIYNIVNPRYRRALMKAFGCCRASCVSQDKQITSNTSSILRDNRLRL
ncbi:growth hormone secretagogue receptor type 1-like [Amphiura filiformis]|uniref:growth hormone secretagogue receptor type 1-like n=1 Tax=Amphiura filiformis TaxID=82378 RepID=UPI003B20DC66